MKLYIYVRERRDFDKKGTLLTSKIKLSFLISFQSVSARFIRKGILPTLKTDKKDSTDLQIFSLSIKKLITFFYTEFAMWSNFTGYDC